MEVAAKTIDAPSLMRRAAFLSLGMSVLLVSIKLFAYLVTHSVSVLASFADSALDLFTSSLNLLAIRSALTPADAEHRFGHGKAEPLAGLAQGAFIAGSATFLVIQAINRFVSPEPVSQGPLALLVMFVSLAGSIGVVAYQRYVVAHTGSLAVGADKVHYTGDVVTNIGVIFAIILSAGFKIEKADPVIALFVAAVLVWTAWGVFRTSYDQLMDHELADEARDKIIGIASGHAEVRNVHDLRTRAAGIHSFIQFHIELDPHITLTRAHEVSDEVEHQVCAEFSNADVIIHMDPVGVERPEEIG
jgi:ferrous-iron efflux pump FieF